MADINKELTQIKTAIYGKDVRGSIHDGIDKINKESEDSKQKASEAHDVMESIINDGFDNAALEANFEQKLDDKIGQLQPEWTQFKNDTEQNFNSVTSQLNDTAKGINYNRHQSNLTRNKIRPVLVIVDDDTNKTAYNIMFEEFVKGRDIPMSFALISGRIGVNENSIDMNQFYEMRD